MGRADISPLSESAPHETVPVRHFSTDAVAPHERHDLWRSQGLPSVGQVYDLRPDPGFTARSDSLTLDRVTVARGQYGAQDVHRTPALLRRVPFDHLYVAMPLDMPMRTVAGLAVPGSAVLLDMAGEWRHRSERGAMAMVAIPRALALDHGIDPHAVHGTIIAPAPATLLREHVLRIADGAVAIPAAMAPRLAGTIVDLLAVSLATRNDTAAATTSIDTALKLQARRLIHAALEQPVLHADHLARILNISRTKLYGLFEDEGGIRRYIRKERLLAARAALDDGTASIAQIAARFHFSDPAHFSRSFRTEFGITPTASRTINPKQQ